jgi:hypothetical protein
VYVIVLLKCEGYNDGRKQNTLSLVLMIAFLLSFPWAIQRPLFRKLCSEWAAFKDIDNMG